MADFNPEEWPQIYQVKWTTYCTLCMGNIWHYRDNVRAIVEHTHQVSPVFKLKRAIPTQVRGRMIYYLPPPLQSDCETAFLVHESCYATICAVARDSGGHWVPGNLVWRLGISLQSIFTLPVGRRQVMASALFEDSLIQYCRSPSAQCDKTGVNSYLHHLPKEVVLKIARYTSQSYYQQCLVNLMQVRRHLQILRSLDISRRIEILDFTKEIHVTHVEISGSSYISGFHDAKVPGSELLQDLIYQKIVLIWDDFGLLKIEPLADVGQKTTNKKLQWYQVIENAQKTTFQVKYKETIIASITSIDPSINMDSNEGSITLWDTPNPPKPTDLRFFVNHEEFPNHPSRVPMRTVDLRHNPIGLMVTLGVINRFQLTGIEAIRSMDRIPQILADAEGERSICTFYPMHEGELITNLWMLEKSMVSSSLSTYCDPVLVVQTNRGRQLFLGPYITQNWRGSYKVSPLVMAETDAAVTSIYYRDLGHRASSVFKPLEIAATCSTLSDKDKNYRHRVPNRGLLPTEPIWPAAFEPPPNSIYFSENPYTMTSASLEKVVRAETFTLWPDDYNSGGEHVVLGALLHYADGTRAAVGDCRVGQADRCVLASPPTHVFWHEIEAASVGRRASDGLTQRTAAEGPNTRTAKAIYFTTEDAAPFPGVGWMGHKMEGRICWSCDSWGSRFWID
ncbi:hypothetical protein IWZ03DRAFT_131132 [Phyllosticta citriasiana]|uniref:F-box domain-containing protein n=1 Tax=Phyllosticta citriasiana TaxID=595635 RepID=A0ABR1KSU2_9PEZI